MNMRELKMRNLPGIILATLCLVAIPPQAHAFDWPKIGTTAKPTPKERLVLMPLRVSEADKSLQGAMETALVEGLQQKYEVFSGEKVAQKASEIYKKENLKKDCDETLCMQNIAMSFQSSLIASASVIKRKNDYFLALSIKDIVDDKAVYNKSLPCKGCDATQVIEKLKELSGASAPAPAAAPASDKAEAPVAASSKAADHETAFWEEVQKGNSAEDYEAYLAKYPKGKYVELARNRINKAKEQDTAKTAQQDQSAWDNANKTASEASYQDYLKTYPQGQYVTLATARIAKLKKEDSQTSANSLKIGQTFKDCPDCPEMVVIPAGSFDMGSKDGSNDEKPVHRVSISRNFAMGKTEVTQAQWRAVMGNYLSDFSNCGDQCPVEQVSWNSAQKFIQKLNTRTGKQYRLPSEAEWEYACLAGDRNKYCGSDTPGSVGWFGAEVPKSKNGITTKQVATKQANSFGLYDMSGNVWEWVEDSWHDNYVGAPVDGSAWPGGSAKRVLRGGSYLGKTDSAATRGSFIPTTRSGNFGFRIVRIIQ